MIANLIRKILYLIRFVKLQLKVHEIKDNVTLVGSNHNFGISSGVSLHCGSTREDVILEEHSELLGELASYAHGKIRLGKWAIIGRDSSINCVNSISIGDNAAISYNVTIVDHNYHPLNPEDRLYMRHTPHNSLERMPMFSANAPIVIGKNVCIGANSRIQKGVSIGDNSIIGACSVVTKSIPANCIAVGNPARVVKENIDKTTTPIFPLKK